MKHLINTFLFTFLSISFVFSSSPKYTFEYNFKKGQSFVHVMNMEAKVSQTIMGQAMEVSSDLSATTSYKVTNAKKGIYSMQLVYDELAMNMDMGNSKISMNSNTSQSAATPSDLGPMIKAVIGIPIDITFNKKGEVSEVTGVEKFSGAMLQSMETGMSQQQKQQLVGQFGDMFTIESLKSNFEENTSFFPEHPVAVGDSWTREADINNLVEMKMMRNITLTSVENNIALLEITGEFSTGAVPVVQQMNGVEVNVTIKGSEKGKVVVDLKNGWIISSDISQYIENEIETNGIKIPQILNTKTIITSKP